MASKKAAVFSHNGLGDGINVLVLSQHLFLNGFSVDTYQNTLSTLQRWFPHLPVYFYPQMDAIEQILNSYDLFFVVWNDSSSFVLRLIEEGKKRFPDRMKVIYIYPSPNIIHEPYYADCLTNPRWSVAENMRNIARKVMKFPVITQESPLTAPQHFKKNRYPNRIVLHPTSGRETRNWDREKFIELAIYLRNQGYALVFIPGEKAMKDWMEVEQEGISVQDFETLDELAGMIYESGYLIGNDSGPGHLASSIGIPTVTICRRKALADLWAPSFSKGVPVVPSVLIPNIRGLRLRDVHWKKFISVKKVLRGFKKLTYMNGA